MNSTCLTLVLLMYSPTPSPVDIYYELEGITLFPDRELVKEITKFQYEHRGWLHGAGGELLDDRTHGEWCAELDHTSDIWDKLEEAQNIKHSLTYRKQCLSRLKAMLGEIDYYNGRMPIYVPIWRFHHTR